jgi:hypothetical protein
MRIYFYILAGIISALIGWNIAQVFLTDLGLLKRFPEIILFPCIAISLAIGMVINEIFISNPTRPKLCLRKAIIPFFIALGLGTILGLISGGISTILFLPQLKIPAPIIRVVGWLIIGISVGLTEGLTWRWETVEAGDPKRFWRRFTVSLIGASLASLTAAFLFEFLRSKLTEIPPILRSYEDPLGFSILGLLLGLTFSLTNSPSYLVALRAGSGFEYTGEIFFDEEDDNSGQQKTIKLLPSYPVIQTNILSFVSDSEHDKIEEGLSIRLPAKGKIIIGSDPDSHVFIPDIPSHVADLEIKKRETFLIPNPKFYRFIALNGNRLGSQRKITLKHNNLITFYPKDTEFSAHKIYRFVYYNRFFDPQG